jgi:sterol desaturase/sphingolipid hydroxylase (fatty acid hydroxylase superfamily)
MFTETLQTLRMTAELMAYSAIAYVSLALLVKGREAVEGARRASSEIRLNLGWTLLDAVAVAPVLAAAVTGVKFVIERFSLTILSSDSWTPLGLPATFFIVIFVGDFISYWRHRLEHTRWLWPAHAIHHSDTQMTWLTLARFHPVNRAVTSCVDVAILAMLGVPLWALLANEMVRHYYGEFIHADFPWTYGPLRWVFVSPAMHQWHHARDVTGSGSNFATVFSCFDLVFGTYYVPGACKVPLGVTDKVGDSVFQQFCYPFVCWTKRFRRWAHARDRQAEADAA